MRRAYGSVAADSCCLVSPALDAPLLVRALVADATAVVGLVSQLIQKYIVNAAVKTAAR